MEPSEGWWTSYGFESLGEYLRHAETGPDRPTSLTSSRRKKKNVQALLKAARMYGIPPATMGRLLVQKGAQLAVETG
jgi:hypothetical protein